MCFKNKRLLLAFGILLCISLKTIAQENGTGIKLFFEKVYLHTDRNHYASGDNIWFKAYLVNAQSNYPVSTSNTLYIELINPANTIVDREVIRVDSGVAVGDFKLADSIAGGSYRIRAYTNWMRNFGNHFIFEKQVEVKNIPGVDKQHIIEEKKVVTTAGVNKQPHYAIHFFPEGGSMVEGIASIIAFKAEDANGNSVDAKGAILTATGDTVAHFKSLHLGMGSFSFQPAAGMQYKAVVQYKNDAPTPADFPVAAKDGYVMKVTAVDAASFLVNLFGNAATMLLHPGGEVTIAAKHGGKIIYKEKTVLKDNTAAVTISAKDFPAGIASITLYDENLHPNCERLVYVLQGVTTKGVPLVATTTYEVK